VDPANFVKAKDHLDQHYQAYRQEQAKVRGLKGPVNINKAPINELMQLPHIGNKVGMAIIEYRKKHGNFKSVSDLKDVPGLGPKIYKNIEDLVTVE